MCSKRLKRPPAEAKHCIFCDRTGVRNEHVWSSWMHEYIRKPNAPKSFIRKEFQIAGATRERTEISSKESRGDVTTMQLKVVCQNHCNGGWMSRMETRVMPILIPLIEPAAEICTGR